MHKPYGVKSGYQKLQPSSDYQKVSLHLSQSKLRLQTFSISSYSSLSEGYTYIMLCRHILLWWDLPAAEVDPIWSVDLPYFPPPQKDNQKQIFLMFTCFKAPNCFPQHICEGQIWGLGLGFKHLRYAFPVADNCRRNKFTDLYLYYIWLHLTNL